MRQPRASLPGLSGPRDTGAPAHAPPQAQGPLTRSLP